MCGRFFADRRSANGMSTGLKDHQPFVSGHSMRKECERLCPLFRATSNTSAT